MSNELIAVIVGIVWIAGIPAVLYLSHKYSTVMELYGIEIWAYVWPVTSACWITLLPFFFGHKYIVEPFCKAFQKMHYRLFMSATKSQDTTFEEFRLAFYMTEKELHAKRVEQMRKIKEAVDE